MQFELSSCHLDASRLDAAMRSLDPGARITLDAAHGRLEVVSSATPGQVQDLLDELGCGATPLAAEEHVSGGTTCCGGCS